MRYRIQSRASDYVPPETATLQDRLLIFLDVDGNDEGSRIERASVVLAPLRSGEDPGNEEVRITVLLRDDTAPTGVISVLHEPRTRIGGLLPAGVAIWLPLSVDARRRRPGPLRVVFEIEHGEGRPANITLTVSPTTSIEAFAALPAEEFRGCGETLTNEQRRLLAKVVKELDTPVLQDRSGVVTTPREFRVALKPGDSIGFDGVPRKILEVARLQSTLRVAGADRSLWLVVHEPRAATCVGSSSQCSFFAVVFDEQTPWVLDDSAKLLGKDG